MNKILLTNDDGFSAQGLKALRESLSARWDVVVVAPATEQSAVSHSLTLRRPLRVNRLDQSLFSVEGTPTDCVLLAIHQLLPEKPDLLVAGINHGPNLGDDVTYSGTVAAAIEATQLGIPSMAISTIGHNFAYAAQLVPYLVEKVFSIGIPHRVLLNVNFPDRPPDQVKGIRLTRLGKRTYQDTVTRESDPDGAAYYLIGGSNLTWTGGEDTDFAAVEKGMISITPLRVDLTDQESIPRLRGLEVDFRTTLTGQGSRQTEDQT
ncbi:MAG: 5'/3'-nucleotidase SurE [Candidatus Latescibacterota bacterium]|nr:MAG: 5'/3'-nucleotidase SurE [Candidatus Latescibacterota bacterium]RKY70670.1 MAG: 5'/3'-nucleotidase SurE [Candidatus Latescibacterota bacterium]